MQQQDILANPAGKAARKLRGWRPRRRKIIGLSAGVLILIVCAVSATCWWGYRPVIVLAGGLSLLSISFMTVVYRITWPEMDNPFRRDRNVYRQAAALENVSALLDGLPENYAVLHDVNTGRGSIDHLAFRRDGAVFLMETRSHGGRSTSKDVQQPRHGQLLEKDFSRQTLDHIGWLERFLKAHAVFEPRVHAAIVFTDVLVEKHSSENRIDVLDASCLKQWLEQGPGNSRAAAILWPQVENFKNELAASDSMRLACQPLLR
jgi:Nuclease-related domain